MKTLIWITVIIVLTPLFIKGLLMLFIVLAALAGA